MKQRIPTEIVKDRSRKLTKLCKEVAKQINKKHIGKKYTILITKKEDKFFIGRAENYKPVIIKENVKFGEFFFVKIINSADIHLFGKLI